MRQIFILLFFCVIGVKSQNTALEVVNQATKQSVNNNPEKHLQSFRFSTQERLLVTANPDDIKVRLDSVFRYRGLKKTFVRIDSSTYRFKELMKQRHLYRADKISTFEYADGTLKEVVNHFNMAGFKQPIYELLGFSFQSFSLYQKTIKILEFSWVNPLSKKGIKKYNFNLHSTEILKGRPCYRITFSEKKNNRKVQIEGEYWIDTQTFAIAKATFNLQGIVYVKSEQNFEYHPSQNVWFPSVQYLRINKGFNSESIRVFGENISFPLLDTDKTHISDFVYLEYESAYKNIELNVPLHIKHKSIALEACTLASSKSIVLSDSTDCRGYTTYQALDTLMERERVEQKLFFGKKIINGYVPVRFIDFDLRHLLKFNNYEGFRLGMGGTTNAHWSNKHKIYGYFAYGLKDAASKFSIGNAFRLHTYSNTWAGLVYTDDIEELAGLPYGIERKSYKLYDPRPINLNTFYNYQNWTAYLETKLLPKTESIWYVSSSYIEPLFQYIFLNNNTFYTKYTLTSVGFSLRWSPLSKFMQTPIGRIEYQKEYPKVVIQAFQTLPQTLHNSVSFARIDAKAEHQYSFLNGQKFAFLFQGGYIFGNVPLTHSYGLSPNSLNKSAITERITFQGKNSFETMYFNEFFTTRYVMLQGKHSFPRLAIARQIKPVITLVSRWAWGSFTYPENHFGLLFKSIDNGYLESGLEVNKIYKGLGLSAFYRYGANALPRLDDNISLKLSYYLDLGF